MKMYHMSYIDLFTAPVSTFATFWWKLHQNQLIMYWDMK